MEFIKRVDAYVEDIVSSGKVSNNHHDHGMHSTENGGDHGVDMKIWWFPI